MSYSYNEIYSMSFTTTLEPPVIVISEADTRL